MDQKNNKTKPGTSVTDAFLSKTQDWQILFNSFNEAILILNTDLQVIQANKQSTEIFNLSVEQIIGRKCLEITGCEVTPDQECPCSVSIKSKSRKSFELKREDKWFEVLVDPVITDKGLYAGAALIFRDITEKKKTEKKLQESQTKYYTMFDKMLNACALHEIICDENGKPVDYRYLDVNPSFEENTGLKAEEIIGKTALEIRPDADPYLIETYGKVALTGKPVSFDFYNKHTDRYFAITAYQPEERQFACMFQNITDLKHTENALRESERKFRILADNPIVGIFISQDKKLIYLNDRMAEMHGYKVEELIGKNFDILIHPDELTSLKLRMDKYLAMGENFKQRFEMLRLKKNGETFWAGHIVTRGQYNGKFAIFGSVVDISDSKQAEEELRNSEERYKEIVEGTDDLIIRVDNNGKLVFANYMANKIFGLPHSDIIGMHVSKCMHPDDKAHTRKQIDEAVAVRAISANYENRQVSLKGEVRHLFWTSNFHYDSQGNLVYVTSIARDITRRRQMEEELKKARDELELRVKERTLELEKANNDLQEKTKNLEDLNTALRILLEKREKDKEENGEKILLNVKELLLPYVNKLKNSNLTENQKNYINLLDSGLQEIISPFAQKITSRYMHITPRELQVGNMVKSGMTSKEIAEVLNTTERTIVAHRANLRKKLGLDKKSNLRTYLISLQ